MNIIFITLSLILGICLGLYLNNIALFVFIIYILFIIFFKKKILIISFIICLFSYFYSYKIDVNYESLFQNGEELAGTLKVVSFKEETTYKNKYIVKFKNYKFILYCDKDKYLEYGDILKFRGNFEVQNSSKNFKSFDYSRYLRQSKIYGNINLEESEKIGEEKDLLYFIENFKQNLKKNILRIFDEEKAGFLIGILLGDKSEISSDISKIFRESSLSHVLALSGLHIVYVSFIVKFLLDKITFKNRLKKVLMIIFLIFFGVFTGSSPSCLRACIMSSMAIFSNLVYRESRFLTNFLISLDFILILNPYNIESSGMWLSFLATFGLVFLRFGKRDFEKNSLKTKIIEIVKTSISCNLMIIPVIWNTFHTISFSFLISSIFSSILIGPILILGYIHMFFGLSEFSFLENFLINFLFESAKKISKLKFFKKIFVHKIPIIFWIIYYILIFLISYFSQNNEKFQKFKSKIKYLIYFLIIIVIACTLGSFVKSKNLEIHFLDVGQGDSCLIITPENKTILIDGGNNEGFDNGENVITPYLLENGISKINYVFISHR